MKKFNLSLVTVLAMSTFAFAGGDIAPVEPMIETPMVEESTPGNFYLGLAYGMANIEASAEIAAINAAVSADIDYDTVMLQAGYKFNPYIALEGRYWIGLDEDVGVNDTLNIDTWGIYVKPMYPVTEELDIYGLLGYADSEAESNGVADDADVDGFSWGIGAAYSFTENIAVFVDYTTMYDDTTTENLNNIIVDVDQTISSWNFGVTYQF